MTAPAATDARSRSGERPTGGRSRPGGRGGDRLDTLAARRTLLALLASGLGIFPLKALFFDNGWLVDVWLTMVVVIAPAALIRLRRAPGALDVWPGIVLLVPWLTARFVGGHAFGGIIPTAATAHDVSLLMTNLHETTRSEAAPIHTTVAVRLVICALLGLLAALIDLIAVVGRRGALAGVPLLVVYTVAGAVPREPVSWVWFVFAAAGYLLLLAIDAGDDLRTWGLRIHTPGSGRARSALAVSTQRIAVAAIVVAVLLPLLVPGEPRNLIADAFHNGGGDSGVGGFGEGNGTAGVSPFAALKGQLNRSEPVSLFNVHMTSTSETQPFYLRVNVLSKYNDDGWQVDDHGRRESLNDTNFETEPSSGGASDSTPLEAKIEITGLSGNAPIFTVPTSLNGVGSDTTWAPQDQLVLGAKVDRGQKISEQFSQLSPTADQLNAAGDPSDDVDASQTNVPGGLPAYAQRIVNRLTAGKSTPYARARAISDYFADPANNFTYDIQTKEGDSSSALVNFLRNRIGYCQQYAAAMAIMLRASGVPARVVLGYMHSVPDKNGNFTVTTSDAHSWVEAYFAGIGWIPFDPTPPAGLAGGAKNDLAYAPHQYPSGAATGGASSSASSSQALPNQQNKPTTDAAGAGRSTNADSSSSSVGLGDLWPLLVVVVVIALALVPALVRSRRRRRRYAAGRRHGDTDALWAELSDTAVDLGYVWSSARSPRQVADWLGSDVQAAATSLQALAVAVEHRRYSQNAAGAPDGSALAGELREVTGELRSRRSGRTRLRALLLPASLRWPTPIRDSTAPRRH